MPVCILAKRRLADVVDVADALHPQPEGAYDLVIGNPPYGRLKLSESMRERYARSLYGHANLYGLFTDLALRLSKPTGVVAYLTPTSFLGGQYFKALRELLTQEASPVAFDFVSDRHGVFDDVLQETLLATYARGGSEAPAKVSALIPQGLNAAKVEHIWDVQVDTSGDPWLLPRTRSDAELLRTLGTMPTRLSDLGYAVSTGPLVWNRHKKQLRYSQSENALPLIWAESVSAAGFQFSADRRNHVPYLALNKGQEHLVLDRSCVLIQRTTSKEQGRRLIAAVVPQEFLDLNGGAVVENMGFPETYALTEGPAHWVPTSPIRMQQLPLLGIDMDLKLETAEQMYRDAFHTGAQAYDSIYLMLAESMDLPVATMDKGMRTAVRSMKLALYKP